MGDAGGGDGVPRVARLVVVALLVLLLVPGLVGFDAWPLTGWRLFSASRHATVTRWVVEATDATGDTRVVSLEELPLRDRHAEWQMAELPGAPARQREAVCRALAGEVHGVEPTAVELTIARDHARLVERGGTWSTVHDLEPFHSCPVGDDRGGDR
ncbi:MAG TPA: hypothetical protein VFW63_00650 [Acidimicrobiales bacterium]|nr:hypothetical protein [Acidimicrobiales bacterium]